MASSRFIIIAAAVLLSASAQAAEPNFVSSIPQVDVEVFIYLSVCFVIGLGARGRDRRFTAWFLVCLLITPLLGLILLLLIPNLRAERLARENARPVKVTGAP